MALVKYPDSGLRPFLVIFISQGYERWLHTKITRKLLKHFPCFVITHTCLSSPFLLTQKHNSTLNPLLELVFLVAYSPPNA